MHGFLGRLADVLARQLLSWLQRRVEPGSREWLDALTAESECADDGWQRLRWALGGVPLVWTINQRSRCQPSSAHRSEEHTSELQSRGHLVCRLLLEKKTNNKKCSTTTYS